MGRKLGLVLVGLGVFVLALGLLSRFYAYDRIAVVPLDHDVVLTSTGAGATIFDIATQQEVTRDLVSTRNVVGDVKASEDAQDDGHPDVAIWETLVFTTVPGAKVDTKNPPLSGVHDRVAFNRTTGAAVDCCGHYLSSTASLFSGEEARDGKTEITGQYFKLPFNAQKRTYQFWDGSLKAATEMRYQATESIQGVTVYRYQQVIEPTKVGEIEDVPASIFGIDAEGNVTLDRIYANARTVWIEPETGVIIRGQEDQNVVAEYQGQEVATLTDALVGYDDATIDDNIETYSPLATQLKILRVWLPIGGVAVGLLLILGGALLLLRARRPRGLRRAR